MRCMWQELRSLIEDFQKSHVNTMFHGMGVAFIVITLASYGTLLGLIEQSTNNLASYLLPLLFFLLFMFTACDGPHRLHDKVSYNLFICIVISLTLRSIIGNTMITQKCESIEANKQQKCVHLVT